MKKKIVTTILMLCMALTLCACGGDAGNSENTENSQNTQQESESAKDSESAGNNSESTGANSESESESELAEGQALYKVIVVDESGAPRGGVMVQVCDETTCFMPVATTADGVAEFKLDEAEGYKAQVLTCPEGYEAVETDYVSFESGKTELTLKIKAKQ